MIVLGLTGSIGMGKSTVAAMLRRAGVPVFDADAEVHRLQGPGGAALAPIEAAFPGTTGPNGVVRAKLGAAVFGNAGARRRLEAIVHPMVRQARAMVREGELGGIPQGPVPYVPGWSTKGALSGWRMDPARVGGSSVLIDIGTHAYHLSCFVSGLEAAEVMAELCPTIPGRTADDYAGLLVRYENGARGTIWATSAAAGSEHGLMFRVFGEMGGLEWHQETPNALIHMPKNNFARTITRRRSDIMSAEALRVTRTEIGHPEGYLEAFANIYSDVALQIAARAGALPFPRSLVEFPNAVDGAAGLAFVQAAMTRADSGTWTPVGKIS